VQNEVCKIAKANWYWGPPYALTSIRATDKNGAGVLTCSATMTTSSTGQGTDDDYAHRFYNRSGPIQYKIEETSDGRPYVTVTRYFDGWGR
jgi:hypothetical protein